MRKEDVQDIIDCFDGDRFVFPYFKERYAYMLLEWFTAEGKSIRDVKQSNWGSLLNKPAVKNVLANKGAGDLSCWDFGSLWPLNYEVFHLTLGSWGASGRGSSYQTTRKGANLVLQINYSNKHDQVFERLKPCLLNRVRYQGHPISQARNTLAWMRLDVSLETNEVLIEEVQTDWLRLLRSILKKANELVSEDRDALWCRCKNSPLARDVVDYAVRTLWLYGCIWDEATLAAGLWFVREQLGISKVYYHTFEGGMKAKGFVYGKPPRSLYTSLPKQFCFRKTAEGPRFLFEDKRHRKRYRNLQGQRWFCLYLDNDSLSV